MRDLKDARNHALDTLCEAYEALTMVEDQLTDKEVRSLIDIAEAIVTIEEILDLEESE